MIAFPIDGLFGRSFQTVVFSGGGNRCWWQAGLVEGFKEANLWSPKLLVGASAGAAIAVASVTDRLRQSLNSAVEQFSGTRSNIEWSRLLRGERPFVILRIYSDWIKSFLHETNFNLLKTSAVEVRVAITRPIRMLPTTVSTAVAFALYSTEKFWMRTLHGRLPHYLGLRSEHVCANECRDVEEASNLLLASGAAVPITPTHRVGGRMAIDGGFYDSIPLPKCSAPTHGTLVLLTRFKPSWPRVFEHNGRIYLQPAQPIPVVSMDCTNPEGVRLAFEQGLRDAQGLVRFQRCSA